MVKFLRRPPPLKPEATSLLLDELDIPRPSLEQAADPRTMARLILRKIEIIQNRAKKLRILQTAAQVDSPWAASLLVELLGDPIEEIRDLAVRELIARPDCPIEQICDRIRRPPWYAKSAALQILAAKKIPETALNIRPVLEDANADVRRSAAVALGEIGGAEARALLVRLSKDKSPYVRAAAAAGVEKLCDFKYI